MSKLRLSDLEYDLGRKQGRARQQVILELLSRGRGGRSIVVRVLGEDPTDLESLLHERSGQVIEMLTEDRGFAKDDDALFLLGLMPPSEVARKAMQMWERGEELRAKDLAAIAPCEGAALVVMGQAALTRRCFGEAAASFRRASEEGVNLKDLWHPWSEALSGDGHWREAFALYREVSAHSPSSQMVRCWARLTLQVLNSYYQESLTQLDQELSELCRTDERLAQELFVALGEQLAGEAREQQDWLIDRLCEVSCEWNKCRGFVREGDLASLAETIEPMTRQLECFGAHVRALGRLTREADGVQALKRHLPALALSEDAEVPPLRVDESAWQAAWDLLVEPDALRDLMVDVTGSGAHVMFTGLRESDRTHSPLAWQLILLIFRRHRGALSANQEEWMARFLVESTPGDCDDSFRALFASGALDGALPGVGDRLAEAKSPWHALELGREEWFERTWCQHQPVLTQWTVEGCRTLDALTQPALHAEAATELVAYGERLTDWLERYLRLPHQLESEYVALQSIVTALCDQWMEASGRGIHVRMPDQPLPHLRLDAGRLELILDVLFRRLTLEPTSRELYMVEVPGQAAIQIGYKGSASLSLSPFEDMLLGQLARELKATWQYDHDTLLLSLPQSSVEGSLAASVPELDRLDEQTRQALRAAVALEEQEEGDSDMVRFLLRKALELELARWLWPYLERHSLLPAANQGWLSAHATEIAERLGIEGGRQIKSRCLNVESAIIKDRMAKGLEDFRSLAVAVGGFSLSFGGKIMVPLGPESVSEELARSLYLCGEEMSRSRSTGDVFSAAYRVLGALATLS